MTKEMLKYTIKLNDYSDLILTEQLGNESKIIVFPCISRYHALRMQIELQNLIEEHTIIESDMIHSER